MASSSSNSEPEPSENNHNFDGKRYIPRYPNFLTISLHLDPIDIIEAEYQDKSVSEILSYVAATWFMTPINMSTWIKEKDTWKNFVLLGLS